MPLTRKQTSLIHVAKAQLHMDDDSYRSVLHQVAGVSSSRDLDAAGFEAVMHHFGVLGFQPRRKANHYGHRRGMASPKQVDYIRGMWQAYTGKDDEQTLNHWLESRFGITALRFVDIGTASKAITALKDMTSRNKQKSNTGTT